MLSKRKLKAIVFQHFDEIEYYKINNGFVKANLEDLSKFYDQGYRLGYAEALDQMETQLYKLFHKTDRI